MNKISDVDECATNNGGGCSSLATCHNVPDNYYCTCQTGYTGDGFTCTGNVTQLQLNIYRTTHCKQSAVYAVVILSVSK